MMPLTAEQLEDIRVASESSFPFVSRCGIRVLQLGRGHCKLLMPLQPNISHIGTMYAGALFTLAEFPGGVLFLTSFDTKRFYPVVKDVSIRFRLPAMTDITVEAQVAEAELARIEAEAEAHGKCEFTWEMELKNTQGKVVAVSRNLYQLRKVGM